MPVTTTREPVPFQAVEQYLSWVSDQTDRIHAILCDVRTAVDDGEMARAADTFLMLRERLELQVRSEEQVLFPLLERQSSSTSTEVIRLEHRHLEESLAIVGRVLGLEDAERFRACYGELTAFLATHLAREAEIVEEAFHR